VCGTATWIWSILKARVVCIRLHTYSVHVPIFASRIWHTLAYKRTYAHTLSHTRIHVHKHTHTHRHTHRHRHTDTHIHIHTHASARAHTRAHTHALLPPVCSLVRASKEPTGKTWRCVRACLCVFVFLLINVPFDPLVCVCCRCGFGCAFHHVLTIAVHT